MRRLLEINWPQGNRDESWKGTLADRLHLFTRISGFQEVLGEFHSELEWNILL